MKIPFEAPNRRCWKYPWRSMRAIGDYFDVPASAAVEQRGVRNAAYSNTQASGRVFRCFTLADGTIRVMVIDVEPGAL